MRKEKQLLLDEVKDQILKFGSFVIMRYSSLTANKANILRREVNKLGGNVEVLKKRILVKAANEAGISIATADLAGHVGVVYSSTDPIEMTKLVLKFSQENDKSIEVIGGRFDGIVYNATDVERLSKLPGKNEMRAQLLGTLEAPMAQTLAVVDALLTSVIHCVNNKCEQIEE